MASDSGPPPVLASRLGYLLKHAQAAHQAAIDAALARFGISGREHALLLLLDDEGPRPQQRLAERLGADRTTMVALVDGLEEKGLVERRRHPEDRRAYEVHLTAKGRRVCERASVAAEEVDAKMLAAVPPGDRRRVKEALRHVIDAGADG
jgi:DNA-binding MarR family transcriptional regulator